MIINLNKILILVGILGFFAAIYMIVSNIFFSRDFSAIAIVAGLISPLYSYLFWTKDKSK